MGWTTFSADATNSSARPVHRAPIGVLSEGEGGNPMRSLLRILTRAAAVLLFAAAAGAPAQQAADPFPASDQVEVLKAQIQQLKEENARLRSENQTLRSLLVNQPQTGTAASPQPVVTGGSAPNAPGTAVSAQQETGYWLTTSSSKRHNRNCRYYKNSNGRFCRPDEGIACKICGG
jgi:hypothetical protein